MRLVVGLLALVVAAPWGAPAGDELRGAALDLPFELSLPPALGADVTLAVEPTSYGALTRIGAYSGEPNVAAAPDGTVYVTGLGWDGSAGGTMVFRRLAGETSFTYLGMPNRGYGGNDEAIAVGPTGTLWVSGMYGFWTATGACASMTSSTDRGQTWNPTVDGICDAQQGIDRQWIAVDGHDRPWVALHEICCAGQHTAYRSMDGGATFELTSVTSVASGFPGNLFVDREGGHIFEATNCGQGPARGPCVLVGTTEPVSPAWIPSIVTRYAMHPGGLAHISGAVDDAGNVYVTFVDKRDTGRYGVYVAKSSDHGLTWSAPFRVSETTKLTTMPWVAAGANGNIALVWYETTSGGFFTLPSGVAASAEWHVNSAIVRGWMGASMPAPALAQLSTTPVKTGPICTSGASCSGDRELLDFFEATVGPTGTLHVVWPQTADWTMRVADVDADLR